MEAQKDNFMLLMEVINLKLFISETHEYTGDGSEHYKNGVEQTLKELITIGANIQKKGEKSDKTEPDAPVGQSKFLQKLQEMADNIKKASGTG